MRFRSITHRLIFGCVVAAIVIYSVSYWHMRQIIQKGTTTWMTALARSRIDAVAMEIVKILQSIEENVDLIVRFNQQRNQFPNESIELSIETTLAGQSSAKAVAVSYFDPKKNKNTVLNWPRGNDRNSSSLLDRCGNSTTFPQPFWTQPYRANPSSQFLAIAYCAPLSKQQAIAVEVTLDWLQPLITDKLQVIDEFNPVKMGQPFAIDLKTERWLVSPSKSIQTLSWFSPKSLSQLNKQSSSNISFNTGVAQNLVDSQGILVFSTLTSTDWALGIAFPKSELQSFQRKYLLLTIVSMVKDMVLICLAVALISLKTTRPLKALIVSTEDIAQGNLDTMLPAIAHRDEVGRLAESFRHMRDALKTQIRELKETTAAKQKMESELSIAGQIQRSMVPRIEISDGPNRRYELSALLQPARQVGGDLYDFFLLGEDRLCLLIGDVADKGVPAALLMARTVTLIRTIAKQTSTPAEILAAVNRELCVDNEECLFVTLFCSVLDLHTGAFNYASGGHDPPLLVSDRRVEFLSLETGPPLGLEEEAIFGQHECLLDRNDLILLYTDGITEAMNFEEELFAEKHSIEEIANYLPLTPAKAIRTIQHLYRQFVGDAAQSDDLTMLAMQYQPSSPFLVEVKTVEWQITINSNLTELEKVKPYLGKILQAEGLAVESIEDAQLIVEEVLVNIIQYGYAERDYDRIDLQVKIDSKTLTMIFEDSGRPFNPLAEIENPDLSMDDEERSQGGLGFYLVKELAERIDYVYADGKNILTVCQAIAK